MYQTTRIIIKCRMLQAVSTTRRTKKAVLSNRRSQSKTLNHKKTIAKVLSVLCHSMLM